MLANPEKGFSIGYIEDAKVFHLGGQSEMETTPRNFSPKN